MGERECDICVLVMPCFCCVNIAVCYCGGEGGGGWH